PGRGMLVLVSDLLTRDDDVLKTLKMLKSRGLEVIVFHVLHPDEVTLPFEGDLVFESLEDDPPLGLDPFDVRQQYQKAIQEQITFYQKNWSTLGVDYLFLETSAPLDQALRYYLLRRKSLQKI
ncbi:MAG: DUF58 domain-containing protein, partial [Nitrospinae bacterium]|nr:DUF58 domain-containing protein [Nitrospinota bacterium]